MGFIRQVFSPGTLRRPTSRMHVVTRHVSGLLVVVGMTGCQETGSEGSEPLTYGTMAKYVVGEAATALQANGRFRLYEPSSPDEITQSHAEAIAAAWPEQFGRWIAGRLEREHGAPISMPDQRVCARTYYVRSAFEQLDDQFKAAGPPTRRLFGPWWLVTLCGSRNQPQVSLAVSAYSTDLRVEDGSILMPNFGGEWFAAEGISKDVGTTFVEQPEELVRRTGASYDRRVTRTPELIAPMREDGFPNHPRWRLFLDKPVTARGKVTEHLNKTEVMSWRRPGGSQQDYQVALEAQPREVAFRYPDPATLNDADVPLRFLTGLVKRRADVPVKFESVSVEGE